MFIDFQNNGAEVLANLLSSDVMTNDAAAGGEESNFDSLLASLMTAARNDDSGDGAQAESPAPVAVNAQDAQVAMNSARVTVRPEQVTAMTDAVLADGGIAEKLIKIDADLVVESDGTVNTIPAAIILMEKGGETESGNTALFLLLDTAGLNTAEKEKLTALLGGREVAEGVLPELSIDPETQAAPLQVFSAPEHISKTETAEMPAVTIVSEVKESEEDASVYGVTASVETVKPAKVSVVEAGTERLVRVDIGNTPIVSSTGNEHGAGENSAAPVVDPQIVESLEFSGGKDMRTADSPASQTQTSQQPITGQSGEMSAVISDSAQNETKVPNADMFVRKVSVETGTAGTETPKLTIETISGEPSLTITPKNTETAGAKVAELIKQYVSQGETVEIAIVVEQDAPAKPLPEQVSHVLSSTDKTGEIVETGTVPGIQNPETPEIAESDRFTEGYPKESKIPLTIAKNQSSNMRGTEMTSQTMIPENDAAVTAEPKIVNISEAPEMPGNSEILEIPVNTLNKTATNKVAPLPAAQEIPAGEQTAQTVTTTSETTHSGETLQTVSIETAPEQVPAAEFRITPEQLVDISAGKTAAPVNQPELTVPAEIEIQSGVVNNSAPAEAGNSVNISESGMPADNTALSYGTIESGPEAVSPNAGTAQSADTNNKAVEANILFSRTQREIIESVKIGNTGTTVTADNPVRSEMPVDLETVTAHTVPTAKPETGAVDTSESGLPFDQTVTVKSVAPQQVTAEFTAKDPVQSTETAVKPQSQAVSAETEAQPESIAHTAPSENSSGETTAASQRSETLKTSQVITPENIAGNGNASKEAAPPEPEMIQASADTVKSAVQSSGNTPEINIPQDEAIAAGFTTAAENLTAKKTHDIAADSSKAARTETESGQSGTMLADAVEMNAQNEFRDTREFMQNTGSSPEQFAGFETAGIENAGGENPLGDASIFGVNSIPESVPMETIEKLAEQSGSLGNTAQNGEINEGKIFESIVRQARFMTQNEMSRADIQLDPPHLGKLRIELVTENSKITGRITVDSPEVKEIIQNSISELRENLAQSGLKVDSFDVNVGHNNGSDLWERAQKFKLAQNNTNMLSASQDVSGGSAIDPLRPVNTARTVLDYSESFDVVV
jgi:flagellar hook-length control protein FliK